ncbi:MAG: hypothetical protein M0R74_12975 [Dehalococcoidia bacterium]|nr:hypothetical protein [Dehalococcoidia bacterium]
MAVRATRQPYSRVTTFELVRLDISSPGRVRERFWNLLPLALSLTLVSSIFWGPYWAPGVFAVAMFAFFAYWLIRSYSVVGACLVGLFHIRRWKRTNWQARYCEWLPANADAPGWDWPRHMVVIPNYKESEEGLARTLESLAAQGNAHQLVVVLAMEAREPGARAKASRLLIRFRARFGDMFATHHPANLPNETPGKGSNEAWAAREAHARLIEGGGGDILRYTVTSCDADAVFHPNHFEALNYLFLTHPNRYRAFWQPTIFNSNNIWDIPAPLRLPDGLSGINRLSNLCLPGSVRFPTSCYSLSWEMLHRVDYWDEEVIPEDWHLYLKCSFMLGDSVHVNPIFLPLGNDCVLTDGYWKTIRAHYAQSVRHAWGASDIPYAWRATLNHRSPLSWRRRLLLSGAVTKVHSLWMAQWYLVTLGAQLPLLMAAKWGAPLPGWWVDRAVTLPGPNWQPWMLATGEFSVGWWVSLTIVTTMIYFCLFPLLALIAIEYTQRGPRPAYVKWRHVALSFAMWPLMAVITFFLASLPALHAQWKLARGTNLVYRVAEKGTRATAAAAAAVRARASGESVPEPFGVAGGR